MKKKQKLNEIKFKEIENSSKLKLAIDRINNAFKTDNTDKAKKKHGTHDSNSYDNQKPLLGDNNEISLNPPNLFKNPVLNVNSKKYLKFI